MGYLAKVVVMVMGIAREDEVSWIVESGGKAHGDCIDEEYLYPC